MIRLKRAKIKPPQIREILQTFVWLLQSMALVSFRRRLFRKNLGNLREFFGQMVYRPFWQKIARTSMSLSYESSVDKGKKIG